MEPALFARLGQTRTHRQRDHALIAPDGHVLSPLPSWDEAPGVVLISPALGARFSQSLVFLAPGEAHFRPGPDVEAFVYVLEGELSVSGMELKAGGYLYWPARGEAAKLTVSTRTRLVTFEKRYAGRAGHNAPRFLVGHESDVAGEPFMGDPDARLQVLLPGRPEFDLAVNLFTFQPGATLPFVETHVMEHGLLLLDGAGIYRLNEKWYPVTAGDCIWMAPYCPQWFAATGKTPARYLYYKDVNRESLEAL